jgi:hypothetical protein
MMGGAGMLRGILVVSVAAASFVAGCGGDDDRGVSGGGDSDDEVSTADDQEAADQAIATFEGALRDEGFAVEADDDDEDDDLEFESDECREFEDAFPGDEKLPGETASAESADFERGEVAPTADGLLESVSGTVEFVEDPDEVDPLIELLNTDRASQCMEEAFRIALESAAREDEQSLELDVEVEHLDSQGLGDTGVGFEATGEFGTAGITFPFSLALELVRVDRAVVSVAVMGLGADESNVDRAALLQVMVDAVGDEST